MSARALPIALPRPNHERLPHNLTVPLIVALSLGEVRVAEPDSAAMPLPLPPRDRSHLRLAAFNGERVE